MPSDYLFLCNTCHKYFICTFYCKINYESRFCICEECGKPKESVRVLSKCKIKKAPDNIIISSIL